MPVFLRVVGRLKMDYHGVRLINGMEGWVLRAFACAKHSMNLHDSTPGTSDCLSIESCGTFSRQRRRGARL